MGKKSILALMLVMVMALSGCSLIEKDLDVDLATVVITVGDETFTKAEVLNVRNQLFYQNAQIYAMIGMNYDYTTAERQEELFEGAIESVIQQSVMEAKVTELGLDVLTADEEAELQAAIDEDMQAYLDQAKSEYFADTTLEGEALDTAVAAQLEELGYTKEYIEGNARLTFVMEKLEAYITADVAVTDEEIQADLDSKVSTAMTNYASNLSSYGASVNNGTTVYYAPAGYRFVKHILRAFTDETRTAITDLQTKITAKGTEITSLGTSITELGEDVADDDESKATLLTQKAEAETSLTALEKELADVKAAAYAALMPSADEVLEKIAAGDDFDALMAEYGEDPGMQSSPKKETGYAVCENFSSFDPAFTTAAMALANVGDTTQAVEGQSGIHIIKYESDIAEGVAALDTVKDTISASLLGTKQNTEYSAQIDAWVADVKTVVDRNTIKN